ncbi:hypothetical protein OQA88_10671 [Cercophora sp. LCS_1]
MGDHNNNNHNSIGSSAQRSPRIPDNTWTRHREIIFDLYIVQDLTIGDVLTELAQKHGFRPSQPQLKAQLSEWGPEFRKYRTRDREARGEKRSADQDPEDQQEPRVAPSLTGPAMSNASVGETQVYGVSSEPAVLASNSNGPVIPLAMDATAQSGYDMSAEFLQFAAGLWRQNKGKEVRQEPEPVPSTELHHDAADNRAVSTGFENNLSSGVCDVSWEQSMSEAQQQGSYPMAPPPLWNWGAGGPQPYMGPWYTPIPPLQYPPGGVNLDTPEWHNKANRANAPSNEQVNIIGTERAPAPRARTGATRSRQPIHQAVQAGCFQMVELYVQKDPKSAHLVTDEGITPLFIAAQGGYINIVKLLLREKVDVDRAEKEDDRAPIHQAAQNGHTQVVEMLLDKKANADPIDSGGRTPLWCAAQGGYLRIIEVILKRAPKANLEAETVEGRRPIHQAAQGGHLDVVKLLLQKGADPDPVDNAGITPLWSAAQQGHHDIVQLLVDTKRVRLEVASHEGSRRPMHQAAQNGHLETINILIAAGADPKPEETCFDTDIPSPFWFACASGNLEIVKLLLEKGADIRFAVGRSSKTALHAAAYAGRAEVAELLLEKECDIDAKEEDGWTALLIAAQEGHLRFLNLLLDRGANIDAVEKDGATALWIASQQGRADIVRRLLELKAKQLPTRSANRRPIHQAAQNGHLAVVKMLLENKPGDLNAMDKQGATPLLLASQESKPSYVGIAMLLVDKGAKTSI